MNSFNVSDNETKNLTVIARQNVLEKDFTVYGSFENPLFLAKDVAEWIEHSDVSTMLRSVDEDEKVTNIVCTPGGNQKSWFVTENGLYEILMLSRKPIAKQFKKEVKKVLHQLRTTGEYKLPAANTELEVLANYKAANDAFVKLLETKVEELKKINQENKPKVVVYDNLVERAKTMNFRDMAAKLKMTQTEFMNILKSRYIYKNSVGEYRAYAEFTDYFTTRTYNKGVDKTGEQLLLSMAGINYFLNKYGCDLTEDEIQNYRKLLADKSYVAGAIENIASKMVEA